MALKLTKHFQDQWRAYFNEKPPTIRQIMAIIGQSVWLQKCRLLLEPDGRQYKLLGTYWHPDRNLVIKIDWLEERVVTVITPKSKGKDRRQRADGR